MGIIYKITSIDTGKVYIGQTIRGIKARFGQHVAMANSKYISPKEGSIQEAIRQYGAQIDLQLKYWRIVIMNYYQKGRSTI